MDKDIAIALAQFRNIKDWKPSIGDFVVKHGWISRTKWFGIVNFVKQDGSIDIVVDGMVKLLVTTPQDSMRDKIVNIVPDMIRNSRSGYAVMKYDTKISSVVWYV